MLSKSTVLAHETEIGERSVPLRRAYNILLLTGGAKRSHEEEHKGDAKRQKREEDSNLKGVVQHGEHFLGRNWTSCQERIRSITSKEQLANIPWASLNAQFGWANVDPGEYPGRSIVPLQTPRMCELVPERSRYECRKFYTMCKRDIEPYRSFITMMPPFKLDGNDRVFIVIFGSFDGKRYPSRMPVNVVECNEMTMPREGETSETYGRRLASMRPGITMSIPRLSSFNEICTLNYYNKTKERLLSRRYTFRGVHSEDHWSPIGQEIDGYSLKNSMQDGVLNFGRYILLVR